MDEMILKFKLLFSTVLSSSLGVSWEVSRNKIFIINVNFTKLNKNSNFNILWLDCFSYLGIIKVR